jgi:hypothetical protein
MKTKFPNFSVRKLTRRQHIIFASIFIAIALAGTGLGLAAHSTPKRTIALTNSSTPSPSSSNQITLTQPVTSAPSNANSSALSVQAKQDQALANQDAAQAEQDFENAQKLGQEESNIAATADGILNPSASVPASTPQSNTNALIQSEADCANPDAQLASLNTQLSQIPSLSTFLSDSGQYGMPAGESLELTAQYNSNFGPRLTNLTNQITALEKSYPACF